MKKKRNLLVVCLLLLVVAVSFYFIGYKVAYDRMEAPAPEQQTFYAVITGINGRQLAVDGMEINDVNFRGAFTFEVTEETVLVWRGTGLQVSELEVGDSVSITFSGSIQETSPARISDVLRLQLLDDEK